MSAWIPDGFDAGSVVKHRGVCKVVKDWYFTTPKIPAHNCDLIVIEFTDGSNTADEGWTNVEMKADYCSYCGSWDTGPDACASCIEAKGE
jgi:hypothetical protein